MSNILLSWQNWADGKQAYGSHLKSGLGLITMSAHYMTSTIAATQSTGAELVASNAVPRFCLFWNVCSNTGPLTLFPLEPVWYGLIVSALDNPEVNQGIRV